MEVTAEMIFEAVLSKIENQSCLPKKTLTSLRSTALEVKALSKHFSLLEVECLICQFFVLLGQESNLDQPIAGMNKREFMYVLQTIFGIDDRLMMAQVFSTLDLNHDFFISVTEWVAALGVFLRGDLEEKTKYVFQVYDLNSDMRLSKNEMFSLFLNEETTPPLPEQDLEDLLNPTFKAMGFDREGFLSYFDFQKLIKKNTMYLEALGHCLPDSLAVRAFERHLKELKRLVKARGIKEENVPQQGRFLNMSSRTRTPPPTSTEKLSGFLPGALLLANMQSMSLNDQPNCSTNGKTSANNSTKMAGAKAGLHEPN